MVYFENGLGTKELIINTARELFYEKGYKKATFAEISSLGNINQGSIYYYFRSKAKLGSVVLQDLLEQNLTVVKSIYPHEKDAFALHILTIYVHYFRVFSDVRYREFNIDMLSDTTSFDDFVKEELSFKHPSNITFKENDIKSGFMNASLAGVNISMEKYIADNIEKLTIDDTVQICLKIYCKLLEIDRTQWETSYIKARKMFRKMAITLDKFNISVTIKNDEQMNSVIIKQLHNCS